MYPKSPLRRGRGGQRGRRGRKNMVNRNNEQNPQPYYQHLPNTADLPQRPLPFRNNEGYSPYPNREQHYNNGWSTQQYDDDRDQWSPYPIPTSNHYERLNDYIYESPKTSKPFLGRGGSWSQRGWRGNQWKVRPPAKTQYPKEQGWWNPLQHSQQTNQPATNKIQKLQRVMANPKKRRETDLMEFSI